MSPTLAAAVALGVVLGLGLWTLVALLPRMGAGRLADRVAPYVLDVSADARELRSRRGGEPATVLAELVAPTIQRLTRGVAALLGGDATVARRLRQAGSGATVSAFRARQLLWAAGGAAAGVVVAMLASRSTAVSPVVPVVLVAVAAASGLLLPEQLLARRAQARLARIADELPTVLEFLSLALSAGETVRDALRRVARIGSGDLARELGHAMADVEVGVPLTEALQRCAASLELPALSRTVEQLTTALDRGSPLVEVLRAQSQDSRDDAKRQLLESAGRKEVAMLVPLVFLILPVTIVFALFPATLVLELGL
ncbi:type II secretion system F family protein [Protaetiibacter sp. SSC-01]|uniref:type II secretion system F family protein n=1 Tax=Protaetiibacter sp. SSC-01 TaxID=2759943 RepID=UPI001656AFC8|nr:type II secretion system F family protein [Protaetiibacter sp. SSC-01]QNO38431.1 type II secretion system F family protein [Protaetiibacter sp. SSC-01]